MKKLRKLLSIPFQIIGIMFLLLTELVAGEKIAWRWREVWERVMKSMEAECTKCGHKGSPKIKYEEDKYYKHQ